MDHARAYHSSNREPRREGQREGNGQTGVVSLSEINLKLDSPSPPLPSLSLHSFRSGREVSLSDFVSSERGKRALSLLAGSRGPMLILFVYDYVCL